MKNIGFKKALLLSITAVMILTVGASNFFSYQNESSVIQTNTRTEIQELVDIEGEEIERFIKSKAATVTKLANDYRQHNYSGNHAERMRVSALAADIPVLTIAFANGDAFASFSNNLWVDGKNPATYDPRTRPWYQQAIRTSNLIHTDPYKDATTGENMVSIGQNIQNGMVILADIPLSALDEAIKRIDIHGAISVIMTADTTVLGSTAPDVKSGEKLVNHPAFSQIVRKMGAADHMAFDYQSDGIERMMFSQKMPYGDTNWFMIVSIDKDTAFSQLEEIRLHAFLFTLLYVVLGVVVTLFVLSLLYRPILALKATVMDLSQGNGDLTQRLEVKTNDDLGQIASGINKFIENLQQLMLEIESSTLELKSNVAKLKHQSDDNALILSHHVQETEQIVTAIEEMSATADSVAQNAGEAAQFTKEASNIGHDALTIVGEAQSKVSTLVEEVDQTSDSLQSMSQETKDISTVLNVIGDIAEQTNLLALNAAIEAARAGEQGRGFAVVADEVRALASRTQTSTEEIEQALTRLLSRNSRVMEAMDGTKNTCQHAFESTDKVNHSINDLTDQVSKITDLSTQIATAAEEQSSVSLEISRNMSSISDIVIQLNKNGDETLSQTDNITQVNIALTNIVSKFKLK